MLPHEEENRSGARRGGALVVRGDESAPAPQGPPARRHGSRGTVDSWMLGFDGAKMDLSYLKPSFLYPKSPTPEFSLKKLTSEYNAGQGTAVDPSSGVGQSLGAGRLQGAAGAEQLSTAAAAQGVGQAHQEGQWQDDLFQSGSSGVRHAHGQSGAAGAANCDGISCEALHVAAIARVAEALKTGAVTDEWARGQYLFHKPPSPHLCS